MSRASIRLTEELSAYVHEVGVREPAVLRELRELTGAMPEGRMQISPEQGALLAILIRLSGARRVIEVGVFTGYSSTAMALALPEDGRIIGCDVSEEWTAIARRFWQKAGIEKKIDLRLAPAMQTLDALLAAGERGRFDLAFLDADKESYELYYERLLELLRPGGLIAVDNTLWSGRVLDEKDQAPPTVAIRSFNARRAKDERVELALLPVGDGMTLLWKR